ncbi:hypothetical protein E4U54_005423 [Claviceps lovelessii]|nr:hypothetical protein E4U54_005423 [Claviceps lovelessii]
MSLKKSADDENGDKSHAGLGEPAAVSEGSKFSHSIIAPPHPALDPKIGSNWIEEERTARVVPE